MDIELCAPLLANPTRKEPTTLPPHLLLGITLEGLCLAFETYSIERSKCRLHVLAYGEKWTTAADSPEDSFCIFHWHCDGAYTRSEEDMSRYGPLKANEVLCYDIVSGIKRWLTENGHEQL